MRLGLLLLLTAIPFLEIALIIKAGQTIGFWQTFLLILLAMVAGIYVIYEQGLQGLRRSIDAMSRGHSSAGPLLDGAFVILAGFLLIFPGFITDLIGLLLLIPPLRRRFSTWFFGYVLGPKAFRDGGFKGEDASRQRHQEPRAAPSGRPGARREDPPVIDGEFHHVGDKTVDPKRAQAPPARDN
jgi:UPF0716 protein FxsA